jgi:hypothetical protein
MSGRSKTCSAWYLKMACSARVLLAEYTAWERSGVYGGSAQAALTAASFHVVSLTTMPGWSRLDKTAAVEDEQKTKRFALGSAYVAFRALRANARATGMTW